MLLVGNNNYSSLFVYVNIFLGVFTVKVIFSEEIHPNCQINNPNLDGDFASRHYQHNFMSLYVITILLGLNLYFMMLI